MSQGQWCNNNVNSFLYILKKIEKGVFIYQNGPNTVAHTLDTCYHLNFKFTIAIYRFI